MDIQEIDYGVRNIWNPSEVRKDYGIFVGLVDTKRGNNRAIYYSLNRDEFFEENEFFG